MDLIKKLTGKNPNEYEVVAKSLVDNSDVELFAKLVKQDDFLFDFIKDNVAKRIQSACNHKNFLNLLDFFEHYSPSYDTMMAQVLYSYADVELLPIMKKFFLEGLPGRKAYALKYFTFAPEDMIQDILPEIRKTAESDVEYLSINAIEVLSKINDKESKQNALEKLSSNDEFVQFEGVKFLVNYQAKDSLNNIIEVMKKSSLAENIASEIPYLIDFEDLYNQDNETALLVLCNILNAIPEIIPISSVCNFDLYNIFENLINGNITSSAAVVLRLAKDKFTEFCSNEEYLFDCDKNTKDDVQAINNLLKNVNTHKLESLFYDELYEGSDFVFFAIDFVDEIEELETLLDSSNQTLVLKVLTLLKEKGALTPMHKFSALNVVSSENLRAIIEVL